MKLPPPHSSSPRAIRPPVLPAPGFRNSGTQATGTAVLGLPDSDLQAIRLAVWRAVYRVQASGSQVKAEGLTPEGRFWDRVKAAGMEAITIQILRDRAQALRKAGHPEADCLQRAILDLMKEIPV